MAISNSFLYVYQRVWQILMISASRKKIHWRFWRILRLHSCSEWSHLNTLLSLKLLSPTALLAATCPFRPGARQFFGCFLELGPLGCPKRPKVFHGFHHHFDDHFGMIWRGDFLVPPFLEIQGLCGLCVNGRSLGGQRYRLDLPWFEQGESQVLKLSQTVGSYTTYMCFSNV